MKSLTHPLLAFILFLVLTTGCQNSFKPVVLDHENTLLWEISKEGMPTSYMYGTMHMINKEYYNFSKNLKSIIQSSDLIIMELGKMPNPVQAIMLMTIKNGSLKDIFSDEQWHTLLTFYNKEFGMSENKFTMTYNKFKPFFLFQSLTQAYFEKDAESYDLNIMKYARENDIEIMGLETIQEQIGFFDQISNEEMVALIMESLETHQKDKEMFKQLQALYEAQEVDQLIPMMKEQSPEFLKYENLFLTNRNIKWIPSLVNELSKHRCFIAVGAAHLFDKNGIIALLKSEGFTVKPIQK